MCDEPMKHMERQKAMQFLTTCVNCENLTHFQFLFKIPMLKKIEKYSTLYLTILRCCLRLKSERSRLLFSMIL